MSKKNYYVITAQLGGDRDIFYYVFTDKTYFDTFMECTNYADYRNNESIVNLIKNYKTVSGLFDWVTDLELLDKKLYQKVDSIFEDTFVSIGGLAELIDTVSDGTIIEESEIIIP